MWADNANILIYPSPVVAIATKRIDIAGLSGSDNSTVAFNSKGIKADWIAFENPLFKEVILECGRGGLPAGIYYLAIETKNGRWAKKFILR
ncbi:MAG: hypothetical protein B6I19_11185 [Bacteroidetes bacterium 4572_114]|nr:MAG: hypothetical protein B6I19_11185 [Bacteroidetes bacterium 4572_114]